jgi:hypothetical protein
MTEEERWEQLNELDDTMLKGGVVLSGWCTFIVQEADLAFAKGAMLASILTAVSGIETYLRSEYSSTNKDTLFNLITSAPIDEQLKEDLHILRIYRNNWVHVEEPWQDRELERTSEPLMAELEEMALFAAKSLRRTIYENQWI